MSGVGISNATRLEGVRVHPAGIGLALGNPYGTTTKGVMLRAAYDAAGPKGDDVLAMASIEECTRGGKAVHQGR